MIIDLTPVGVGDTRDTCALIGRPMDSKAAPDQGAGESHPLRSLFIDWQVLGAAQAGTPQAIALPPALTGLLPLQGAGGMLGAALVTAAIATALLKYVAVDEAVRGLDSGRP